MSPPPSHQRSPQAPRPKPGARPLPRSTEAVTGAKDPLLSPPHPDGHTPSISTKPPLQGILPSHQEPVLRVMPMPADANVYGDVFGGWIMAQVDIAGSIPATRRAEGRVATVAVNSFTFNKPVFVGDLLSFYADIIKIGTTSITVSVEVYAQRQRLNHEVVKITNATLVYVAIDAKRQSRALPFLAPSGNP